MKELEQLSLEGKIKYIENATDIDDVIKTIKATAEYHEFAEICRHFKISTNDKGEYNYGEFLSYFVHRLMNKTEVKVTVIDYDACFDEICYVPDYQENIAVLQDIPQNRVFISKSQKRKAAINPKLDITRFHEGLTYQNQKTFVWKQSKSTTKMKIIASFTVIKRRAKTLVVKTQANEKMTLYLRVVNGCEVALLWDKNFNENYWHLKTTDIISTASEIEEAIEIQELEKKYSRIHEDKKFVESKFYTLNGVLYEVMKTFTVNHKRYVMLWNNETNSPKDYPVMEYRHYEAVYLNEEKTMILCAANPLKIIDTDISEHFVCNPESTIDYDACFDEECFVPDYQGSSAALDDIEIDKQPQCLTASKLKKSQLEKFYLKPRKYYFERKAYQAIK